MRLLRFLIATCVTTVVHSKLLIDYKGGQDATTLGLLDMEAQELGDHVTAMSWDTVIIQAEEDSHLGVQCLHYKRTPHYRRAEVKALQHGGLQPNNKYYFGYSVRLSRASGGLVIFQWKKQDKDAEPQQNIPFELEFKGSVEGTNTLSLEYTTPGSDGSNRTSIWSGTFSTGSSTSNVHNIGFKLKRSGLCLWTGETYPKWGIYRGEAAAGSSDPDSWHTFNSYVYRVQVSDSSKSEVAESAGW
ncbi:hypothetical protein BKA62DRAFT_808089 [Auriculariales sp. MPI-PUGE-AT-0066]|nr:hypothetical protein BKA62DRAFT_808089 [Auriculariales sp. MPI-PUGE-AT-0066]